MTTKSSNNCANGDRIDNVKPKRRNKSDLGPNFIAPDGGWGWLVVLAGGVSNLCTFPVLQQFGLLFRDRLTSSIGMTGSQITTIINLNSCLTSCVGLINGPMFRKFSYRQVAWFGACLVAIGVYCTSIADSFVTYVLAFSVLYGVGSGINASSNALALNTYFKNKRRIATGLSWTLTGLGPIIFPHIIALLLPLYGVQGTVLIFCGIALNAMALSLIFQPVKWHIKSQPQLVKNDEELMITNEYRCEYCTKKAMKKQSFFSSQYLHNSDHLVITGYEIIDPGTPMLPHANDGWSSKRGASFGSRNSYDSNYTSKYNSRKTSCLNSRLASNRTSYANNLIALAREGQKERSNKTDQNDLKISSDLTLPPAIKSNRTSYTNLGALGKQEKREKRKEILNRIKIEEAPTEDCPSYKAPQDLTENSHKALQDMMILNNGQIKSLNYNTNDINKEQTKIVIEDVTDTVKIKVERKISGGDDSKYMTANQSAVKNPMTPFRKISTNSFKYNVERELLKGASKKLEEYVNNEPLSCCTCDEERRLLMEKLESMDSEGEEGCESDEPVEVVKKLTLFEKIYIFFDLDLLRDFTYVNLMMGVTIANFAELNYSILTPFVLSDYGFSKPEIATVMSLLGAMDISVRFFVPFMAEKIGWENKTFFLIGILGMAFGRISVAHFQSYTAVMIASCWIGLNKGLRTVFMALVIPSYVPLNRLPAATGLQLLFAGIFYFVMGPLIGWIRDTTNYTVTLHCLNIATFLTAICWGLDMFMHRKQKEDDDDIKENNL